MILLLLSYREYLFGNFSQKSNPNISENRLGNEDMKIKKIESSNNFRAP